MKNLFKLCKQKKHAISALCQRVFQASYAMVEAVLKSIKAIFTYHHPFFLQFFKPFFVNSVSTTEVHDLCLDVRNGIVGIDQLVPLARNGLLTESKTKTSHYLE
jgi:hypothetical protein